MLFRKTRIQIDDQSIKLDRHPLNCLCTIEYLNQKQHNTIRCIWNNNKNMLKFAHMWLCINICIHPRHIDEHMLQVPYFPHIAHNLHAIGHPCIQSPMLWLLIHMKSLLDRLVYECIHEVGALDQSSQTLGTELDQYRNNLLIQVIYCCMT